MSFRHTVITEFLYKFGREDELAKIAKVLDKYGNFKFQEGGGKPYYGYFHGIIKDGDGHQTKLEEESIIKDVFDQTDVKLKIVYE